MNETAMQKDILKVLKMGPHSARGLAGELKTTVPTIYRALAALAGEWSIECIQGPRPSRQRGPVPTFFRLAGKRK